MSRGLRYRAVSVLGTVALTILAVVMTNLRPVHNAFDRVPYFGRPAPEVLPSSDLTLAVMTTVVVVVAIMWPLFKPRPRRILDTVLLTQKRVLFAMIGLAALGYFNYSYRLPRTTLMLTTMALLVSLPLFMITIRRRPADSSRAIIVGDDPEAMESLLSATDLPVLGYVSPPSVYAPEGVEAEPVGIADGGRAVDRLDELPCLGGLARLDEVIVEEDVDTALLAFAATGREEFFGAIETCHDHGVSALAHEDHTDHILTDDFSGRSLLTVDLEPWDWQDHILKRGFDVVFAASALVMTSPIIAVITAAIKLKDGGPVLYHQERTAAFGDTFTIAKFRSMIPNAELKSGAKISEEDAGGVDQRVTRVGRVLRKTHLDEIPQLWAILVGDMSVVGPRPERPELDFEIEDGVGNWRRRWFVKPGLTGLAQINDATGAEPERKLRYDIEYIRRQSFWFDLKIVVRQLWQVGTDALGFVAGTDSQPNSEAKAGAPQGAEDTDIERDSSDEEAEKKSSTEL
jgi:lipopolysaccharide/colanic/teichoic acid biosynthesis glycosyltransferase